MEIVWTFSMFNLIIIANLNGRVHGQFNMTEYYKMPKLYLMDDYDRCLEENNTAIYCIATTIIKPNDSSELWEYIKNFSSNKKKHFRHDRLVRGICINHCKEKMSINDYENQMSYFLTEFEYESEMKFDPNIYRKALDQRIMYNKMINQCINFELKRQYELMGYSQVEYCISHKDHFEFDNVDIAYIALFLFLIVIVILSTYFDCRLRRNKKPEEQTAVHYKNPTQGSDMNKVSFSLLRNWHKLISCPKTESDQNLRCIYAMRFLSMYCVIAGHTILFLNVLPVYNPQYIEMSYYRFITMTLINGHTVIQTYFAISGFLLSVQFINYTENQNNFSFLYFFKAILYRYIRLTPVYAFVILFHATLLVGVQDGPLWKYISETERTFCRNNWWTNLLYINNYVNLNKPCLQHGWYLATDFQLFIIGITLHMIIWRFPKSMKGLLSLTFLISYIIPGLITYINKFEDDIVIRPESQRYGMWLNELYRKIYVPTHTNSGTYITGMIAGIVYRRLKKRESNLNQNKSFVLIWYAIVPIGILLLLSAYWFYACELKKPAFWVAVYAAIMKNFWGVVGGVLIIGNVFGIGWIARNFLCSPIFRPLGRITYCVYLCHPFVLRVTMGNLRQPIYMSDITILIYVSSTLILSYLGGTILCITLEIPITTLQNQLFSKNKDPAVEDNTIEIDNYTLNI